MNRIWIGSTNRYLEHYRLSKSGWSLNKLDLRGDEFQLMDDLIQHTTNSINYININIDKKDDEGYDDLCSGED